MSLRYELAVFDLDGTLCDTAPDIGRCLDRAMADFGLPPVPRDKLLRAIGPGGTAFHRAIMPSEEAMPLAGKIVERYRGYYMKENTELTRPFPGIVEMLEECHGVGLSMAVASNKPQEQTRQIVTNLGLDRFFFDVAGPESVALPKPAPDIIHRLMEWEGAIRSPQCSAMVGDTDNDMNAGRAAGVTTVFVTWGYMAQFDILSENIDRVVSTPSELASVLTGK